MTSLFLLGDARPSSLLCLFNREDEHVALLLVRSLSDIVQERLEQQLPVFALHV